MTHFDYLPGPKIRARPRSLELGEQMALYDWVCIYRARYPQLWNFTSTANGGVRPKKQNPKTGQWYCPEGKRLNAAGVSKGYPDIILDWPAGHYHGLRIELKESNASESDFREDQREWCNRLIRAGYRATCCFGWMSAANEICKYLGIDPKDAGLQ
jgi:hypothetical protein